MAINWSGWQSLNKPSIVALERPFVHRNQDGRLEVFAIGAGAIFNIWQTAPNGGWAERWGELGKPSATISVRTHVVGRNADGRQEIFAIADDGAIWQKWQVVPNGGWSDWKSLGKPTSDISFSVQLTAGINLDGRQELFALGSDGNVWQIWQTAPNGGWSNWALRGAPPIGIRATDRLSVAANQDGREELFAIGKDASLWHTWQVAPNVGWSDWQSLGKPSDPFDGSEPPKIRDLNNPVVQQNADGHLEVFAPGNGAFCNRWQELWQEGPDRVIWRHQGWNQKPKPAANVALTTLDAARDFENRLEAFGFADDGALWHAWQVDVAPFWSSWQSLGAPSAKIRDRERLTIGTNLDERLEVFVIGGDGAGWHVWQVR